MVQIDPTFELEGLPVGENWRGAGEFFYACVAKAHGFKMAC